MSRYHPRTEAKHTRQPTQDERNDHLALRSCHGISSSHVSSRSPPRLCALQLRLLDRQSCHRRRHRFYHILSPILLPHCFRCYSILWLPVPNLSGGNSYCVAWVFEMSNPKLKNKGYLSTSPSVPHHAWMDHILLYHVGCSQGGAKLYLMVQRNLSLAPSDWSLPLRRRSWQTI